MRDLAGAAASAGLALRGGFLLRPEERVGPLASARTIVLLGFVGAEPWSAFASSQEASDGSPHPLDRWSLRVVGALGERFGGLPLFPFEGPPYWPFQAWAQRAEPLFPSPLGVLIHPRYGLWHAYRGALALWDEIELPERTEASRPCDVCDEKPCLSACPVGAFTPAGYAVDVCAAWVKSNERAACRDGCLARLACPVGTDFAQSVDQRRFHMDAFLAARS